MRVSFSILDPWSKGNYEEALRRYWREEIEPTQAMIDGKALHEQWRMETEKTQSLPKVFGGNKLEIPEVERKMTCMIDGWIEFVGVIDIIESDFVFSDYKTGNSSASRYSNTFQIPCYHKLLHENGYTRMKEAYIRHYNQHKDSVTVGKLYLSDKTMEKGEEFIRTFASEMKSSIEESEYKNKLEVLPE